MAKTLALDMDAVIFDLEDSVAEHAKQTAQENLAAFFKANSISAFFRIIRINTPSRPRGLADPERVRDLNPDAILLPKVEEPETISRIAGMLSPCKAARPVLWAICTVAMIETPKGILQTAAITTLVVGPNDITAATDVTPGKNRTNLHPWLMQIVLASHGVRMLRA